MIRFPAAPGDTPEISSRHYQSAVEVAQNGLLPSALPREEE